MTLSAEYQPEYSIFYDVDPAFFPRAKQLGISWVGFMAADPVGNDRNSPNAKYYFDSPTLRNVPWATQTKKGRNGTGLDLKEYVEKAHKAGLEVMANLEDLNPQHWTPGRTQWTPELIAGVARDLHNDGASRWFTECVEQYPSLFDALVDTCKKIGMVYQEGTDPSALHGWEDVLSGSFVDLYKKLDLIAMYHYHYRREEKGTQASPMEEGTLGYAFARGWGSRTALVYPMGIDWGESPANWEGILKASIIIRALQFRIDEVQLISPTEEKLKRLDIPGTTRWLQDLVKENSAEKRPILNMVINLRKGPDGHWKDMSNCTDAITCGAFHAGYDVIATTEPMNDAGAYYVYTTGTDNHGTLDLTPEIAALFSSGKKVFLQLGGQLPTGPTLTANWKSVIESCGVDPQAPSKWADLPAQGVYDGHPQKVTGVFTAYTFKERPKGTVLPAGAVTGHAVCSAGETPLVISKGNNNLILANDLRWQMMEPISYLLNDCGVRSSSNVWGIGGSRVSAFLALQDTNLDAKIPGLKEGTKIHVQVWDKFWNETRDEAASYAGSLQSPLKQFDTILVERVM